MNFFYTKQSGVALLQVLLMSAVISVLALQMSYSAKDKVSIAQVIQDKVMAEVAVRTMESELLFALSTARWAKDEQHENKLAQIWNFYGSPFEYEDIGTITIQDNSGLISVFNGGDRSTVERAFERLLGSKHQARVARNALIDTQGFQSSTNGAGISGQFFQSRQEMLRALKELGIPSSKAEVFTRIPYSAYLPLQAPDESLKLWLPERQAKAVIESRQNGELTPQLFTQLTGLRKSDYMLFYPSGRFIITLKKQIGDARVQRKMFINVSPTNKSQPIWSFGVEG
ncbi:MULTISPECIES: hypothetical protein [Vibrio]|uniref:hypothetical protein n=1 Tax=Vibrio TaxID=662 RepID=UPI000940B850|nr:MULTISPECIES: hypothetical protein [Vibrio]MCR9610449.1 hypothetical protein [Vibrio alginolyticus]AVF94022.1 hypothetical protein AL552_09475 [Vibrio diabolicus]MCQ9065902.1 hypothetical protein [Vibrio diabolicus]MCR9612814.1 hypothetical protein [Vibrio alginolyticus]MCS0028278.1 hypothetical protein [Vibrio alginolyticus]